MGKFPISYKAYDNQYAAPMGISLSVGGTFLIGGLMSNEVVIFVIGVIGIVLFFVFKILNSITAQKEAEERLEENIAFMKNEVENLIESEDLTEEEKLIKILELAEAGNSYAVLLINELAKITKEGN